MQANYVTSDFSLFYNNYYYYFVSDFDEIHFQHLSFGLEDTA